MQATDAVAHPGYVAKLLCQYASDQTVTILDINHSIPKDLHTPLPEGIPYPGENVFRTGLVGGRDPAWRSLEDRR